MLGARCRFASLWVSQSARSMADHCLRIFAVLTAAQAGVAQRESAWHLVVALFVFPAVFLSPVNGAISNALPKRRVLIGAAAFSFAAIALLGGCGGAWLWLCLVLVAAGSALYFPTRYAMLPAVARDAHLPLARANGWIESGAVLAIVGGMILGGVLYDPSALGPVVFVPDFSWPRDLCGFPTAVAAALLLSFVAVVAAVPARFASDVFRPEPPGRALAGFFRDSRRVWRDREARGCLLGISCFRAMVAAIAGAVIANALAANAPEGHYFRNLVSVAVWTMAGAAAGSLLASVQGHPSRSLGLVPFGVVGLLVALALVALHAVTWWTCLAVGAMGGLVTVPLNAAYQASVPADARGNAMSVLNTVGYGVMTAVELLLWGLARSQVLTAAGQLWFLAVLTALGAAVAWRTLFRDSLELLVEIGTWPFYRVRARGPGLESFPARGPVIVIGNHTSWLDPVWLFKMLPRRITPMMTSAFYDKPVLRWLMRHVTKAIRVPASAFRREAPELREAIAAIDRGECVLIFPEGYMRRREDRPLRQFGQGVWHILRERPDTPVVVCWIEGGWGSYTSYCGGPPLANKRPDCWRHIDVAVGEPHVLDASLLDDHRATRAYLMRTCLNARGYLDLKPLQLDNSAEGQPALLGED